jgi:hypothetical protein
MDNFAIAAIALALIFQAEEPPPGVCKVPEPPPVIRPTKPERPAVPACVDEARSRHNCRASVIAAYNRQMETYAAAFDGYVTQMNGYVDALNRYIAEVNAYSSCERRVIGADRFIAG